MQNGKAGERFPRDAPTATYRVVVRH
jgi:hypothetical protein